MDTQQRYFPSRAMITETSSPLGDIKINYEVIANIVRLSALQVTGVVEVSTRFVNKLQQVFSKKREVIDGVLIEEEGASYAVRVRVQMAFGVELAKVAYQIQDLVRDNLQTMANISVSRVDVVIDSIQVLNKVETKTV